MTTSERASIRAAALANVTIPKEVAQKFIEKNPSPKTEEEIKLVEFCIRNVFGIVEF